MSGMQMVSKCASRYCHQSLRLRVAAQNRFRRRAEPLARSLARLNREREVPDEPAISEAPSQRGLGTIFSLFWDTPVVYSAPYLAAIDARDTSLRHVEERSLAVIAGGVPVTGGIALLVNPVRHRKRARSRRTVDGLEAPHGNRRQDAQPEAERDGRRDPTIEQGTRATDNRLDQVTGSFARL
jgi:hypothetical protein